MQVLKKIALDDDIPEPAPMPQKKMNK